MDRPLSSISQIFFCLLSCLFATSTLAQVTPDNTLDTQINSDGNVSEITGGQTRGNNLFHSFQDFSIQTGSEAFFNNADNISNIFSRVTGGNISNIDGLIRANGSASLFLINPNGIIFGENAQLNIGGSFLGSTAESILFDEGEFSANLDTPLLTISQPIGLGLPDNPAAIVNRSTFEDSEGNVVGLEVLSGNNLSLIGGNIQFIGGRATARGGQVELGGLSSTGTIGISEAGSLIFPENVAKADVNFTNTAVVNVRGANGGNIIVNAANLNLTASRLEAGIAADSASSDAQAGDVEINLTDNLSLDTGAINNIVEEQGVGNAGDVKIATGSIEATNGGFISAGTRGQGDGGDINIDASEITLNDSIGDGFVSNITSRVEAEGTGDAGNIAIATGNLILTGGGIDVITSGQGNGGNINITATEDINVDARGFSNGILSTVGLDAVGNAGNVNISTSNLTLANGGQINASTSGQGDAGDINLTATEDINLGNGGLVSSKVLELGNAGDVNISTRNLTLTNEGEISVSTSGQGNAGNVDINATEDVSLSNGGLIFSNTFGSGDAGNVNLIARDIVLEGLNLDGFGSSIFSDTFGQGNAGNVDITARDITLKDGGFISSDTFSFGSGNAGSVDIIARNITLEGENSTSFPSSVSSRVAPGAVGDGGNVTISTGNLTLSNGGFIFSDTEGRGNAGSVDIIASDISLEGQNSTGELSSTVSSRVGLGAVGDGGNVTISTGNLTLKSESFIASDTEGEGNAGNLNITATENLNIDGFSTRVSSTVTPEAVGTGGNIAINTGNLTLTNSGFLSASTFSQGNAGNIEITASNVSIDEESLDGFSSSITSRVETGAIGEGGNVIIDTSNLTIANVGFIDADTFGRGNAGNVRITADNINLKDAGQVSTSTFSRGNAGNIEITTADLTLDGSNTRVNSVVIEGAVGNGGNITIIGDRLNLNNGGQVSANTSGQGNAGNINIAANSLRLANEAGINAVTQSSASNSNSAANINLQIAEDITLSNNSSISARALENANGGNVSIDNEAGYILAEPQQNNDITANAQQGQGGNIEINTQAIFGIEERSSTPANQTNDIDASSDFGLSGTVEIDILEVDPSQDALDISVAPVQTEVTQTCEPGENDSQSEFVVTGRSGLPDTPEANLSGNFALEDWRIEESLSAFRSYEKQRRIEAEQPESIVEADSWHVNQQGKVVLVADNSVNESDVLNQESADCHTE